MKNHKSVGVIIAAAGSGSRMGGVYKPLEKLCGKEMILYSLDTFMNCDEVAFVVISARSDKMNEIENVCKNRGYSKPLVVVAGGKDRQDSVENAFFVSLFEDENITHVAIHDAARPLFDAYMAKKAFETAFEKGSAVCAGRVRDTVKRTDEECAVTEGVERDGLWLVQTPQIFVKTTYFQALRKAREDKISVTDDSSLVKHSGEPVYLCDTPSYNIKITYPEDVFLAEAIIEKRGMK